MTCVIYAGVGWSEGGDERELLAFCLFAGATYYPSPGVEDLIATADTIEELKELPAVTKATVFDWWQIVESRTLRIIEQETGKG